MGAIALTFWSPAATFGQFCVGRGFIKKDQFWQSLVKEWAAALDPQITCFSYPGTPPFTGLKTFFYGSGRAGEATFPQKSDERLRRALQVQGIIHQASNRRSHQ